MDKIKDLPNEEWKEIKGYGGKYLVSNCGRIKSLKHFDARLLTAFVNNKGYPRVALSKDGQSKHFLVSRLVAEAFCANPDPERARTVDHIDGDKENNRADNLRWLSFEDNMREYSNRKRKQDTKNHTQTGPYVESNSQVSRSSSCLAIQLNEDPTHFISRQKLPQVATMTANDHVESSQSEDTTSGRKVNPHPTESEE